MTYDEPTDLEALAGRLRRALEEGDLDAFGELLDPHVRWGGPEETADTCHTRAEVLARYSSLRARLRVRDVRARILDTTVGPKAIVLDMQVTGPEAPGDRGRVQQTFSVSGGLIIDIRG